MTGTGWRGLLHQAHERLLGTGMGERTKSVLRGAAQVGAAAVVAKLVTGMTSLLSARWLGPEGWGEVSLAQAAALWLQVPLLFGLPTALSHAVPRADRAEREEVLRAGTGLLALTAGLTLLVGVVARGPLAVLLGVTRPELALGLAWCAGSALNAAGTSALSATEQFRRRAMAELLFAGTFALTVLVLRLSGALSWTTFLVTMAGAYALAGILIFALRLAPWPTFGAGLVRRARGLLSFGSVAALGFLAVALMQAVTRQVMDRYGRVEDVGVLGAYQAGSIQMALYLQMMLTMVIFPVASRTPDRRLLFRKVTRLLAPLTLAAIAMFGAGLVVSLLLLGHAYPLRPVPVAAFSVAAGACFSLGVVAWVLASGGPRAMLASTCVWLVAGLANAGGCWLLVPRYGLVGAGIAAAVSMLAGVSSAFLPVLRRWADVA